MKYIKMFIAGLAFPSVLVPFLLSIGLLAGKPQILTITFLHFIPLIWGIWNILYFVFFKDILPGSEATKLLLTGGILGFLVAVLGIFWFKVPNIMGVSQSLIYLPLILGPVIYAIFWLYIVKPLNDLLDVQVD